MTIKRMLTEFGFGTSIRSQDYTGAAIRGLKDALWRNSISIAEPLGFEKKQMLIDVEIAVQKPNSVKVDELANIIPYGHSTFKVVNGGLDILNPSTNAITVVANVAVIISFDLEKVHA